MKSFFQTKRFIPQQSGRLLLNDLLRNILVNLQFWNTRTFKRISKGLMLFLNTILCSVINMRRSWQKSRSRSRNSTMYRWGCLKERLTKVLWSEIVSINFSSDKPEIVRFKYSDDKDYRKAIFSLPKKNLRKNQEEQCKWRYAKPCGITKQKKTNSLQLCEKQLIPSHHHQYYQSLPINQKNEPDLKVSPKKTVINKSKR